jgi:hypothetical protein
MILSLDFTSPIPPDGRFAQAMMTTRLPNIGEPVMIVGFRSSEAENLQAEDGIYFPVEDARAKYGLVQIKRETDQTAGAN